MEFFYFLLLYLFFLEAISRFIEIPEVRKPLWIIIVGGSGLLMNLSGLAIFKGSSHIHSHSHSHCHGHAYHNEENNKEENKEKLNIHGIFLHILGDALGSIGAILSGLGIWFLPFGKYRFFVDPICSIFIACIILTTAIPLVRRCTKILMQSVPDYIDLNIIRQELLELDGVVDVHDLHIWQLADTKVIGTVHLTCPNNINFFNLATNMKKVMHSHGIHSTTFQPEFIDPRHIEETQQCTLICGEPEQCKESMCCDPLLGDEKQFLSKREKKKKTLPVELP
jgi:zinc transporter 1